MGREVVDEVVVTGITLLYAMMARMNNPLKLVGAVFAKPGRVDGEGDEVELVEHADEVVDGKVKKV